MGISPALPSPPPKNKCSLTMLEMLSTCVYLNVPVDGLPFIAQYVTAIIIMAA